MATRSLEGQAMVTLSISCNATALVTTSDPRFPHTWGWKLC